MAKSNSDRRLLRSKKRGQENKGKVVWCDIAPIECTCSGNCKNKRGQ